MNYLLHLLIYINIYAILALSLNLVVGYCGLLTMAHAAYFAVGGYTYALATQVLGWGFVPATGLAMAVSACLSLAISLPAWRFRGDFFVLISLAVQTFIFSLLYNWSDTSAPLGSWRNLTNGPFGIAGIAKPDILGFKVSSIAAYCVLASVSMAACCLLFWLLKQSPWGRLLKCMRDDELAARGLGKNTRLAKTQAFAIACMFAALAGALYAGYVSYLDPSSGSLDESILMLCMVLVGGVGNFRGPLVGAVVLLLIPEALRFVNMPDTIAANMRLILYGLMIVGMTHFRPQGLAGEYRFK
jgi:branched-chain amino acid transport system permease protein